MLISKICHHGLFSRGVNSHRTSGISDTNMQTDGTTEMKIVKISSNPPLVNGKLLVSPGTSF